MPYATNAQLPDRIRKYLPQHAQDIFRAAFNAAYERYGPNNEDRAFHMKCSVVACQPRRLAMLAQVMTSPTITVHVNDPLNLAAQKMWDADIGALPVVNDEGKLTGMITDRDICMAAYTQGRALDSLLVNCAMAKHPIAARPEQHIGEVEQLMSKYQVRRIPVVDAAGKPVGIVSMNDLAIESVQPDTQMKHGPSKIARTLAAICQSRIEKRKAA